MKKCMIVLLSTVMAVMLTGCSLLSEIGHSVGVSLGSQNHETQESGETSETEPEIVMETASEEVASIEEHSEENSIKFKIETNYDSEYDENTSSEIARLRYDTISITSDSTPELKAAIDNWNADYSYNTEACYHEYAGYAKTDCLDTDFWFEGTYYGIEGDLMVRRADQDVFTFLNPEYSYFGGAHGYYGYGAYNFDSQTGENIAIGDVVTDAQAFCDAIETEFLKSYSVDDLLYFNDLSDYVYSSYFSGNNELGEIIYIIGHEGVTVYFNPYEIASYAMGTISITIRNDEYPGLLAEQYFENNPTDYIYEITTGDNVYLDLQQDKSIDSICVYGSMDEYGTYSQLYISLNGNEITQECHFYSYSTYYVKNNGFRYLYVQASAENDYQSLMVFDLNGNEPFLIGEIDGAMESTTDPTSFNMYKRLDALSTYSGLLPSYVGSDGIPTSDTNVYILDTGYSLTSTVSLTGELIDANTGESLGMGGTAPAGSNFEFAYTDGLTYVIFDVDGVGLLKFNVGLEWPQTINGFNAEECFETLYFAG